MSDAFPETCRPIPKGAPQLDPALVARWAEFVPSWTVRGDALRHVRQLRNFQAALDWIVQVGAVAEAHDHHPDMHLTGWNHVELVLTTHSIGGLSPNDFVVARAIEGLARKT